MVAAALSTVALLGVAAALGWVFQATSFGYASAFRAWMTRGDGSGLAAGVLVAAVAALVIVPVSALAEAMAAMSRRSGRPVVVGAALFGLGMQLGNGCASGTLYAAGGGSRRMWVVLPFFCAGGVLGSLVLPAALELPSLPPVGLGNVLGPWGGLAATLALAGGLAALLLRRGPRPSRAQLRAAVAIGALAALAFLLSGQPWGVTIGADALGREGGERPRRSILRGAPTGRGTGRGRSWPARCSPRTSSLMDIGLILGATTRRFVARPVPRSGLAADARPGRQRPSGDC